MTFYEFDKAEMEKLKKKHIENNEKSNEDKSKDKMETKKYDEGEESNSSK